ncbi:hypothetical protein D0962_23435 [Leptolyngbyaceae cyanobacterium CCMR0082]|uniref:Uncharacterized protein n=1 Tax=Adonisia turfae CCMR0082 TaxID=2304604 RepID=A0A6M0SC69_9CYAN|nr:hypothetical protein [Adonisia turfae]NEZ65673.1 hypothetical protein [Adonisia turfae CCMR0082]
MARTYRVEEIAQLFGKQLVANATYQIGTAGTSKAPGQTIRVNGIPARAETTIAAGGQVLLVKSGDNWFAYGRKTEELAFKSKTRRRRGSISKEANSTITVLFRIDYDDRSEIWIAEGRKKKMIKSYPLQVPYLPVLRTHAGGQELEGNEEYQSGSPGSLYANNATITARLFNQNVSGSAVSDFTYASTLAGDLSIGSSGVTYSSSFGIDANSVNVTTTLDAEGGSNRFTYVIRFAFPAGDILESQASGVGITSVGSNFNSTSNTTSSYGLNVNARFGPPPVVVSRGRTSGSSFFSNSPVLGERLIPLGEGLNGEITNFSIDNRQATIYGAGSGSEVVTSDFFFPSTLLVKHRPIGYLSKVEGKRFVGVEYIDTSGAFSIDYFVLGNSLNGSLETNIYPNIPATDPSDPSYFFITKDGQGLGLRFRLQDGNFPSPAFNVYENKLVAFLNYDDPSIFARPTSKTLTLIRQFNGINKPVQINGLGVLPSKILAVGDIPIEQ